MLKRSRSLYICIIVIYLIPLDLFARGIKGFQDDRVYTRAEVLKIEKKQIIQRETSLIIETVVHLKVLEGIYKGKIKLAIFRGENDMPKEMFYKKGDTVYIGISKIEGTDQEEYISLYDIDNSTSIIMMIILLIIFIVIIGRIKGIFSLLALIITIMLLFFVLVPLTLKGYSPLPISIAISIFSIIITLPIIAGIKLKTLAAIIGASTGIILSAFLAFLFGFIMHLSGIVTNEMLTVFYASNSEINIRGLALAGMIIAALGAIMDVCISISSSTAEIFNANPKISEGDAFKSVLNIGTDILGSMVNTLILAYVGSSLSLILFISIRMEPGMPLWMVLNYNPVLSEIVKSIVGSIGMFCCIPLTAFISVKLYKKKCIKKD
ncbi:MAG: YibE/F family protein [Spirochaetota bacterium]|nr:YibE/F family protein [Spirochaetota bacterium]